MKLLLAILFFVGGGVFVGWLLGSGILDDYRLSNRDLIPSIAHEMSLSLCKPKIFVLTSCDIWITEKASGERIEFDYLLAGFQTGRKAVVLQDIETGELTTDLGIETVQNRFFTLAALVLSLIGMGLFPVFQFLFSRDDPNQVEPTRPWYETN